MRYFRTYFAFMALAACMVLVSFSNVTLARNTQADTKTYNAEYYVLDNGMQIVVIPNNRVPAVTHMVWYKAGAADEPQNVSGIAHFMEHLMFKGSPVIDGEDLNAGEFSHTVRRLGGNDNAFTSQDYTAYFQSIPKEHLKTVMRMEAGRMQRMNLTQDDITAERAVILEERSQRTDNNPEAQLVEKLKSSLYPHHPYGIPVIGWRTEMEKLDMDDALTFHDTWYKPNNAILVVSGDVTGAAVLQLAKDTYGRLPSTKPQTKERNALPEKDLQAHTVLEDKNVRQPVVYKLVRAPSSAQDKKTARALEILANIMGGGSSSRLYTSLVIEQKVATAASLSYDPYALDGATIWIHAIPTPDHTPEEILAALDAELKKLLTHGITEKERTDSITRLQNAAIYARDSLTGPAMHIGRGLVTGNTLDDIEYWPRDIENITTQDIMNAANAIFSAETQKSVTGFLLPASPEAQEDTPQ